MKKIDSFINRYPISKTLRFALIPMGKTEENFNNAMILETDRKRTEEYKKAKKLIDKYHKYFIENVLSNFCLEKLSEYAELYFKSGKNDTDLITMEALESEMRKDIKKAFSSHPLFKSLFGQDIIKNILPEFLTDKREKETIETFYNFNTYFSGFHENRKNIYSDEAQSTAIGFRCINDNLPKFLDNTLVFTKLKTQLSEDIIQKLNDECISICNVYLENLFTPDYFNMVLSQSGIDEYNSIIGGYTKDDGTKIQGVNEYINLYNQQIAKTDRSKKLPLMKILYKQILSDKETISFLPESFENDNQVITSIKTYFNSDFQQLLSELNNLFEQLSDYNPAGIFIKSGVAITELSNAVFKNWSSITNGWNSEYEKSHPIAKIKNTEKYYETRDKSFKNIKSFSVASLQEYGNNSKITEETSDIISYLKASVSEKINLIKSAFEIAKQLLSEDYTANNNKKLCKNENAIKIIKELLDSVKELEKLLKPLLGTGKEDGKDELFYGDFLPLFENISAIDKLYDKVRNYITKKPYSKDKIKLNFDNPQHLGGWDRNKERDYRTIILKKGVNYYLAIMNKNDSKLFINPPSGEDDSSMKKMEYKLLPGPNKMLPKVFFAASNIDVFKPSKEILDIRKKESFKKGTKFDVRDCHKFIDFFKDSINLHEDWSQFGFQFSPTETYNDISEFYNEVKQQGYMVRFKNISEHYIDSLVEDGKLYLFKIYNKDFSLHSKGTPNLHTLYFKMLFDEENLANVVYQLNGGAEMFYRDASINDMEKIIHPANQPITNKNADNSKKQSLFDYDIIKDRRFTRRQFSLHLPITLNFKADGQTYLNNDVRKALKYAEQNYVVGIDRGERNLLYICVINHNGEIVEQKSLNEIIATNGYKTDYHTLLDTKEKERDSARKTWGIIENIKELKEGYLSQVVNEICSLVLKYDAIIAMEDLNFGFKKGRFKVEKQVYQKFENMLITKLNFLVRKNLIASENGGLLKAYQLTNKLDGVNRGRQNGFIFYVPAWLTSKIDPVTGFVDLLKPKYTSVADSLEFVKNMDNIRYNEKENMFEFDIDYTKFKRTSASYIKKWTICTNGERIITFRNKDKNNNWDCKTIILTNEFKELFSKYQIDYQKCNIKEAILSQNTKDFHQSFIRLFSATLQMRNSETGNVDVDYLISPVKDQKGNFYDSRIQNTKDRNLPENADANGAFNIARKALWAISVLKETDDESLKNADLSISYADWLEYAQNE